MFYTSFSLDVHLKKVELVITLSLRAEKYYKGWWLLSEIDSP